MRADRDHERGDLAAERGTMGERRVHALLLSLAFLYLVANAAIYGWYAWSIANYPFAIDYGEGHVLQRVLGMLEGRSPYPSFGQAPFLIGNYPPLFDLLVAIPSYFSGPQLLWGRLTSITATVTASALIGFLVHRQTGQKIPAWLAGLLFLASHWLAVWSVVSRIDLLSVAFTLAGLLAFAAAESRRWRYGMLVLSAVLFAAALYTRHSAWAGPLACLAFLSVRHLARSQQGDVATANTETRAFKRFGVALTLAIALPALLLQGLTDGNFLPHISSLTVGQLRRENLVNLWGSFATIHSVALLLAAAYAVMLVWRRAPSLPVLFWLLALASTLSAANTGSYINYFQEAWAATCVLCGLLMAQGPAWTREGTRNSMVAILLALALLFQLSLFRKYSALMVPGERYAQVGQALVEWIRQTPGDILSEDTAFMALAGKRTVYQPFSMSKLVRTGKWDPAPILDRIKRQSFGLILMQSNAAISDRWTPDVVAAVERHYEVRAIVPVFEVSVIQDHAKQLRIFVPKSPPVVRTTPAPASATDRQ